MTPAPSRPLKQVLEIHRVEWDRDDTRSSVREAFAKVVDCGTGALGAEVFASDTEERVVYHTCKSRACPSCGYQATRAWQRVVLQLQGCDVRMDHLWQAPYRVPIMPSDNPFKWRQFEPALILQCVRWYLRYALSYRDLEDMMRERGLCVDHTTIYRWVQRYAPEIDKRCRPFLRRTNDSYRIDETYVRVAGAWTYLGYIRVPQMA